MLSVVVTIVDGGERLARCLSALEQQVQPPELEIIVPHDDSAGDLSELTRRFPTVQFLDLGKLSTRRPAGSPAGQHELYDRRRSAGLAAARGELVALLEDRGAPRPDWARSTVAAHTTSAAAAIGGAIENVNGAALNWAVYFCDFGRYALPFQTHPAEYVSDTNICYKRPVLLATQDLWRDRYHETTVHWSIQRNGERLLLTPEMVVDQDRGPLKLRNLLPERFHFGRLFAYTRVHECSPGRRAALAAGTPVLPWLMLARIARRQLGRPSFIDFLRATPRLLLLLGAWALGEAAGYVTGTA